MQPTAISREPSGSWRPRVAQVALTLLLATSMCACQPMLFRQDHRITITYPGNFSTVNGPVTIRWSARAFNPPADGTFAVFVDRDPMPAGETVRYFDSSSRNHNIYLLTGTRLTLEHLDENAGATSAERNHHDVTVVLLDPGGHRIGESAGFTQFTLRT